MRSTGSAGVTRNVLTEREVATGCQTCKVITVAMPQHHDIGFIRVVSSRFWNEKVFQRERSSEAPALKYYHIYFDEQESWRIGLLYVLQTGCYHASDFPRSNSSNNAF